MGLLDKTNPFATRESVVRHAKIFGVFAAVCCGIYMIGRPSLRENWWIWLPLCSAAGAALGALMEWQLDDSLDINLVADEVEDEFGIKIPVSDREKIQTPGDLLQCVLSALAVTQANSEGSGEVDEAQVWTRLQTVLVKSIGLDRDEVTLTARFCPDLEVVTYPATDDRLVDAPTSAATG